MPCVHMSWQLCNVACTHGLERIRLLLKGEHLVEGRGREDLKVCMRCGGDGQMERNTCNLDVRDLGKVSEVLETMKAFEGVFDFRSSLVLALVFFACFLLFDSYHLNLLSFPWVLNLHLNSSYIATNSSYGLLHARLASPDDGQFDAQLNKQLKSGIEKLESDLRRARASIRKAVLHRNLTSDGEDYVPRGGIYRNALAFQRSYIEMEKRFKIFVYPEGEPPLVHNGPCKNIYTIEGRFIHELELGNPFVTSNPEEAHVHFLPFSVTMMVTFIYKPKSYDLRPMKRFVSDYVDVIAKKYPYWNRSLGSDHFMLSCHDWGPDASKANTYLYKNSIRVLCNANSSEGFNPRKDATLPEVNLRTGEIAGMIGGRAALKRPILAFFAGGNHGPVRPILINHWKGKDDDVQVYEYLPKGASYYDFMKKSRYCLCPSGYEVASPRIVEAIYSECVPVIISENYVLPFSDVLNWTAFSVQVPVSEIPNLKRILQSIPVEKYIMMQKRVKQVQGHFAMNQPPKRYDIFHMILHSIWLRRLNIQISQ
eukprot:Gb_02335 [translate_table: standard]